MPADQGDDPVEHEAPADPRAGLPADERALLEAFDRLRPQGTLRWNFDDAVRRLTEAPEAHGRLSPWGGLPADLWERGRSARASERVLGDVVKQVAQELSEYTDQAVHESARLDDEALAELRTATLDAVRFLSARVERLEAAVDPLGIPVGELDLPAPDTSAWVGAATGWATADAGLPVVVGELGDRRLAAAVAGTGVAVDAVDPRGGVVWGAEADLVVPGHRVTVTLAEVVDHLRRLAPASRGGMVLSGCVDRAPLAVKLELVEHAVRVLAPGGTLALLVTDQAAWGAGLDPVAADLLPGHPLHPETWRVVLADRGLPGAVVRSADRGPVHAVVVEVHP